jgi:hypothetical protein
VRLARDDDAFYPRTAAWMVWRPYGREAETAVHEAGHAAMAYVVDVRFHSTSIVPDNDSRGRVVVAAPVFVADLPPQEQVRVRARKYRGITGARLNDHLLVRVAGAVAVQIFFEGVPWQEAFAGTDERDALRYAAVLWPADADIARAYIDFTCVRARKLLGSTLMRDAVRSLARELLEARELSRRRVGAILRAANVPRVG